MGARSCPGKTLAIMEMKVLAICVAMMLNYKVNEEELKKHNEVILGLMTRQNLELIIN
jgi:cytochrome P450